jgi:5-methylcytosine-specific restriction protein A
MPAHQFIVGQTYNRKRDIHGKYAGQERGGIATPSAAPLVFAFTSEAGAAFGYEDKFQPDGVFWYTGEGQVGNMQMIRGNAAIANHAQLGKSILLFESTPKGEVRFLGEADYLGDHIEQRPDRNRALRNAIIFHLGLQSSVTTNGIRQKAAPYTQNRKLTAKLTLSELRSIALESVAESASSEEKLVNVRVRAEAIRRYALRRANGVCEGCKSDAPFKARNGPFLEVHHVFRLADGGPDHPGKVVALCPNCHRRAHYALDAASFNESLIQWLAQHETT